MSLLHDINKTINITTNEDAYPLDQNPEDEILTLFVLWGLIVPLIAMAGLIGNILTIVVLWRREMHSTTILYLRALVITDTGILIGSVITLTPLSCANYLELEALTYFKQNVYPLIHAPGYYIIMTLQQCNVWITVSVSMERYIAICHPFRAARLITRRKTIIVLITIIIVSLIYNIPHLLATTASVCDSASHATPPMETQVSVFEGGNDFYGLAVSSTMSTPLSVAMNSPESAPSKTCLKVADTVFGTTKFYNTYRTIMYSIIIYVIPFLALLILNSFLIKELMTMQRRRSGTNIHDENEANLSMVLVLIVIVFIFCQTPGLISQFDLIHEGAFVHWLAVSNLLFTTNSAVNFLIYTAFGRKFRRVLLRVFRHIFRKNRRQSQSSYRTTQYTNGDVDGLDPSEDLCTSLGMLDCCRKQSHSNADVSENIPLNVVADNKKTTVNGTSRNSKYNNGSNRVLYSTAEDDSEKDTTNNSVTTETSTLVRQQQNSTPQKYIQPQTTDLDVRNSKKDKTSKSGSIKIVEHSAAISNAGSINNQVLYNMKHYNGSHHKNSIGDFC